VAGGTSTAMAFADLATANLWLQQCECAVRGGQRQLWRCTNFSVGSNPNLWQWRTSTAMASSISRRRTLLQQCERAVGQDNGSFSPATNFSVGSNPRSVAVADLQRRWHFRPRDGELWLQQCERAVRAGQRQLWRCH
jgi:hypothetical protein